ncbi:MAG: calcium/proton exchanger, partial [Bellilinea sp.]
MNSILAYVKRKPLTILLLAFLFAIIAEWQQWGMIWVFALSALGVIPLAGYIGEATEVLAVYTGPKIG